MKTNNTLAKLLNMILLIILVVCIKTCMDQEKKTGQLNSAIKTAGDSIHYWRDRYGNEHARRKLTEGDHSALELIHGRQMDSLTDLLRISKKQLKAVSAVGSEISQTVPLTVDTVFINNQPVYELRYQDHWTSIIGQVKADSSWLHYFIRDSLVITTYTKRKWLLGRKETFVDAFSQNPNLHIKGLTSYKLSESRSRLSVGPYFGIGYCNGTITPSLGFALQYSLIDL